MKDAVASMPLGSWLLKVRSSDRGRTDFCRQDICSIFARTLHRILGWPRGSAMVLSDRFRGLATGQRASSRQELLSHPWHHRGAARCSRAVRRALSGRGSRMDMLLQLRRPVGMQFCVIWFPARRLHGRKRRDPGRPRADWSL